MTPADVEVYIQRGRIVRALVEYGGTAFADQYFDALCDAGEFNQRHPSLAIPKAYAILRYYPPACSECHGESAVARETVATIGLNGAVVAEIGTKLCPSCEGSGFFGIAGYGERAKIQSNKITVPR